MAFLFILEVIVIVVLAFVLAVMIGDRCIRSKGYRGPVSDHFDGVRFHSIKGDQPRPAPVLKEERGGFWKTIAWMLRRDRNHWEWRASAFKEKPRERVMGGEVVATFVGHATLLIQTEGVNILTDPIWSLRASPFSFAGPKRHAEPGIPFDALPPIDVILLSHNHYDHMDLETLARLAAKFQPKIIVPLGNTAYLASKHISGAKDFEWWQSETLGENLKITAVPSQHFSARALSDRDKTLWCGYVIETMHGNIYFAGDTAYGPFVQKIHERYPKFRLAFLPIGAYLPQWFMRPVHASPDEAFRMHHDLACERTIGIHFGTFRLADDGQDLPPARIKELIETETPRPDFTTLNAGESVIVK